MRSLVHTTARLAARSSAPARSLRVLARAATAAPLQSAGVVARLSSSSSALSARWSAASTVLRRSLSSAAATGSGSGSGSAPVQKVLDDEDLRAALNAAGSKLVVVDWYAEWCAPCRRIAPLVEQLAEQTPSAVFLKADIDTLEDASVEAGVQSVPTFHFIKDGQLVAEFSGADMNKLKELVAQYK